MEALAIVLREPRQIAIEPVGLTDLGECDARVEVAHTAISAGTERLLWAGEMPSFPGMGYPLVPGYETVGTVVEVGSNAACEVGDAVFVPGARCYRDVRPLFGGAAQTVIAPAERLHAIPSADAEMTLLALAATAHHAVAVAGAPGLVIGHGVLGRLIARITVALGHPAPVVHEVAAARMDSDAFEVVSPDDDARVYAAIIDASGRDDVIDAAVSRLTRSGTLTLAGFYGARLSFAFPAAFMREASVRIAAEWQPEDMRAVRALVDGGSLSLAGLITHEAPADAASAAYTTAFTDPSCLKMVLNWKGLS